MKSWHWLDKSPNAVLLALSVSLQKWQRFSSLVVLNLLNGVQATCCGLNVIYSYKEDRPHFRCDKITSSEDTASTNGSAARDLPQQLETNSTASSSKWIPVNEHSKNSQQSTLYCWFQLTCLLSLWEYFSVRKERVKVHLSVQRKHMNI